MGWKLIDYDAPVAETVLVWNGQEVAAASRDGDKTDWWTDYDRGDYENGSPMAPQPTHWMAMPPPPQ